MTTRNEFRSIVTTRPAAVAQAQLMLELARLQAKYQSAKPETHNYLADLQKQLETF